MLERCSKVWHAHGRWQECETSVPTRGGGACELHVLCISHKSDRGCALSKLKTSPFPVSKSKGQNSWVENTALRLRIWYGFLCCARGGAVHAFVSYQPACLQGHEHLEQASFACMLAVPGNKHTGNTFLGWLPAFWYQPSRPWYNSIE